jgi:dihydrofolate synthase/folylpolyglutamate synthase
MVSGNTGYSAALKFVLDREHFGMKLGLENISRFLDRIGSPHNRYPSVHIAGTNGKGSTASYIESILRHAGYKTGIFTSPHLIDFRERIKVDGRPISKKYVTDFVREYRGLIIRNKITFFEVCTALAFCYFADCRVDIAVVEVGLGGRLDATNTLRPILSIITDISYDHTQILGETLEKIAFEKAGIIKAGVPVLVGIMKPEPKSTIADIALERKAPTIFINGNHFRRREKLFFFDYRNNGFRLDALRSALPGRHQVLNAALSVRAMEILGELGFKAGRRNIRKGLRKVDWPGRFQIIRLPNGSIVILDVAHNPAGFKATVECFKELFPGRKADILIGFVKTKDFSKSISYLKSVARSVEICRLNTYRSANPEEIAAAFGRSLRPIVSESTAASSRKVMKWAAPGDIILVCGSHFMVGDFLIELRRQGV